MSPRKVRLVADLLKKKSVEQALQQLKFLPKAASKPLIKLLNSATANAKNNLQILVYAFYEFLSNSYSDYGLFTAVYAITV